MSYAWFYEETNDHGMTTLVQMTKWEKSKTQSRKSKDLAVSNLCAETKGRIRCVRNIETGQITVAVTYKPDVELPPPEEAEPLLEAAVKQVPAPQGLTKKKPEVKFVEDDFERRAWAEQETAWITWGDKVHFKVFDTEDAAQRICSMLVDDYIKKDRHPQEVISTWSMVPA